MSVYIDVWHRTHPLTREAHDRFLDYYGRYVVAPPSDYFEVVGAFRYLDGATNEDFALYRYASMAQVEASMLSFGADREFVAATAAVFEQIEIEETRGVALHLPYSPEARIEESIADGPPADEPSRRYFRSVRSCGGTERPQVFEQLGKRCAQIEAARLGRLVAGFHYLVGPVMDLVEIWLLPEEAETWLPDADALDPALEAELARFAPERERRHLTPTGFSRLR